MSHLHDGGVSDNSTGDIAANSYKQYMEDIACLKETGVRPNNNLRGNLIPILLGGFLQIFYLLAQNFAHWAN
jgi:hypothetical protein